MADGDDVNTEYDEAEIPDNEEGPQGSPFQYLDQFPSKGPFECDRCGFVLKTKQGLERHRILLHNLPNMKSGKRGQYGKGPFKCNYCDKVFKKMYYLTRHQVRHLDVRSYVCYICAKGFKHSEDLATHMHRHREDKPFKCKYCPATFKTNGDRRKHSLRVHPSEEYSEAVESGKISEIRPCIEKFTYVCKPCGISFPTIEQLSEHEVIHADQEDNGEQYMCDICGWKTSKHRYIIDHRQKHSVQSPFRCNECPWTFFDAKSFEKHKISHRTKDNTCHLCRITFQEASTLKQHFAVVHKEIEMPDIPAVHKGDERIIRQEATQPTMIHPPHPISNAPPDRDKQPAAESPRVPPKPQEPTHIIRPQGGPHVPRHPNPNFYYVPVPYFVSPDGRPILQRPPVPIPMPVDGTPGKERPVMHHPPMPPGYPVPGMFFGVPPHPERFVVPTVLPPNQHQPQSNASMQLQGQQSSQGQPGHQSKSTSKGQKISQSQSVSQNQPVSQSQPPPQKSHTNQLPISHIQPPEQHSDQASSASAKNPDTQKHNIQSMQPKRFMSQSSAFQEVQIDPMRPDRGLGGPGIDDFPKEVTVVKPKPKPVVPDDVEIDPTRFDRGLGNRKFSEIPPPNIVYRGKDLSNLRKQADVIKPAMLSRDNEAFGRMAVPFLSSQVKRSSQQPPDWMDTIRGNAAFGRIKQEPNSDGEEVESSPSLIETRFIEQESKSSRITQVNHPRSSAEHLNISDGFIYNENSVHYPEDISNEGSLVTLHKTRKKHDGIPLSCHICGKAFRKTYHLRRHLVVHSDVKPYQCHLCPMMFKHTENLKQHLLRHSAEKAFRCQICVAAFSNASDYLRHIYSTHKLPDEEDGSPDKAEVEPSSEPYANTEHLPQDSIDIISVGDESLNKSNMSPVSASDISSPSRSMNDNDIMGDRQDEYLDSLDDADGDDYLPSMVDTPTAKEAQWPSLAPESEDSAQRRNQLSTAETDQKDDLPDEEAADPSIQLQPRGRYNTRSKRSLPAGLSETPVPAGKVVRATRRSIRQSNERSAAKDLDKTKGNETLDQSETEKKDGKSTNDDNDSEDASVANDLSPKYSRFPYNVKSKTKRRCPICKKWFRSEYHLKMHARKHDKSMKKIGEKDGDKEDNDIGDKSTEREDTAEENDNLEETRAPESSNGTELGKADGNPKSTELEISVETEHNPSVLQKEELKGSKRRKVKPKCSRCGKVFQSAYHLRRHDNVCPEKANEIADYPLESNEEQSSSVINDPKELITTLDDNNVPTASPQETESIRELFPCPEPNANYPSPGEPDEESYPAGTGPDYSEINGDEEGTFPETNMANDAGPQNHFPDKNSTFDEQHDDDPDTESIQSSSQLNNQCRFQCSTCLKSFRTLNQAEKHALVHKEIRIYACEYCSIILPSKLKLKEHLRSHKQTRPYQCSVCTAVFSTSTNLYRHERNIHHMVPTYRSFTSKDNPASDAFDPNTAANDSFEESQYDEVQPDSPRIVNLSSLPPGPMQHRYAVGFPSHAVLKPISSSPAAGHHAPHAFQPVRPEPLQAFQPVRPEPLQAFQPTKAEPLQASGNSTAVSKVPRGRVRRVSPTEFEELAKKQENVVDNASPGSASVSPETSNENYGMVVTNPQSSEENEASDNGAIANDDISSTSETNNNVSENGSPDKGNPRKKRPYKRHYTYYGGPKSFDCRVCGKSFKSSFHVRRHELIHDGVKPHKCHICDKGFTLKETLTEHLQRHKGERSFLCSVCGSGFVTMGDVRHHERKVHNMIQNPRTLRARRPMDGGDGTPPWQYAPEQQTVYIVGDAWDASPATPDGMVRYRAVPNEYWQMDGYYADEPQAVEIDDGVDENEGPIIYYQ